MLLFSEVALFHSHYPIHQWPKHVPGADLPTSEHEKHCNRNPKNTKIWWNVLNTGLLLNMLIVYERFADFVLYGRCDQSLCSKVTARMICATNRIIYEVLTKQQPKFQLEFYFVSLCGYWRARKIKLWKTTTTAFVFFRSRFFFKLDNWKIVLIQRLYTNSKDWAFYDNVVKVGSLCKWVIIFFFSLAVK